MDESGGEDRMRSSFFFCENNKKKFTSGSAVFKGFPGSCLTLARLSCVMLVLRSSLMLDRLSSTMLAFLPSTSTSFFCFNNSHWVKTKVKRTRGSLSKIFQSLNPRYENNERGTRFILAKDGFVEPDKQTTNVKSQISKLKSRDVLAKGSPIFLSTS